ncbi:MAG: thioredoxin fold domain-containing protein [Sulfurospirillaceae bacterium]|nr:thioredoxin fold domain-containing protein [Sulfurospirillaceae bacterium]MDD2827678.1 thioredoxin fold domain-containing protein [Sulfurospirillaceae bacterium]
MRKLIIFILVLLSCSSAIYASFLEKESYKAQKEKKLILLTVESDTCPYCLKMKKTIFNVKKYSQKIGKHYIHIIINVQDQALPSILHAKYLPTNYILSPKKLHIIDEFPGYMEPEHFLELLDEVYRQEVK